MGIACGVFHSVAKVVPAARRVRWFDCPLALVRARNSPSLSQWGSSEKPPPDRSCDPSWPKETSAAERSAFTEGREQSSPPRLGRLGEAKPWLQSSPPRLGMSRGGEAVTAIIASAAGDVQAKEGDAPRMTSQAGNADFASVAPIIGLAAGAVAARRSRDCDHRPRGWGRPGERRRRDVHCRGLADC